MLSALRHTYQANPSHPYMLQLLHVLNLLHELHNIIIITGVKLNDACNDILAVLVDLQVKLHFLLS